MAKMTTNYLNNMPMPRNMTTEFDFSLGMKYINSAIEDKYVKTLVNFDIKEMGAALAPRKGLRTFEVCIPKLNYIKPEATLYADKLVTIYAAKPCLEDGKHYKQVILGRKDKLWVATVDASEDMILQVGADIDITELQFSPDPLVQDGHPCTILSPGPTTIHGIPLVNSDLISSVVGTFGFGNSFFFFDQSDPENKRVCYTEFEGGKYVIKYVTPRELTAAEAPLRGYNMVSPTPYYFVNDIASANIPILQGIMPYDAEGKDGKLLLKPKQNQLVAFRCYLAAATDTKYKILWESKQVGEVGWIQRQRLVNVELTGEDTDIPLLTCSFVPPEKDTLVRVQIFKRHVMAVDAEHPINPIPLVDIVDSPPTTADNGEKYFNPKEGKLYTRVNGAWDAQTAANTETDIDQYYFNEATANYYQCYYDGTLSMLMLDEERYDNVCDHQITVGFDFSPKIYGDKLTETDATYDVTSASGLVYWKSRLVAYGMSEDPTLLLLSDYEDPSYFPYPNNLLMFDEPIVAVVPYVDDIMVFTEGALYAVSSMDGISWSTTKIQGNLWLTPWDRHLVQVTRNLLFFRSGMYYYMIVPRAASMTGELTLAPISTPIKELFDDFKVAVDDMFNLTYGQPLGLQQVPTGAPLINYFNYLDFEDIHNIYVFQKDQDGENDSYVHLDLLYNTVTRAWKTYIYEAPFCLSPYQHDATQPGKLCSTSLLNIATGRNHEYHLNDPLEFTPVNAGPRVVLATTLPYQDGEYHGTPLIYRSPITELLTFASLNPLGDPAAFDSFRIAFYDEHHDYPNQIGDITFSYDFLSTDIKLLGSGAETRLEAVSIDGLVKIIQYMDLDRVSTDWVVLETMDAEAHLIPYSPEGLFKPLFHDAADAPDTYKANWPFPWPNDDWLYDLHATPRKNTMFQGPLLASPGTDSVVVNGTNEFILPCPEISIVPVGDEYLITIDPDVINIAEYFAINTGRRVQTRVLQLQAVNPTTCSDFYIPYLSDLLQYGMTFEEMVENTQIRFEDFTSASDDFIHYKNYQYVDSGYRDVQLQFDKRYRELQINLNKVVDESFDFGIDFILDGEVRPQHYDFLADQTEDTMHLTLASVEDFNPEGLFFEPGNFVGKIWRIVQPKISAVTRWKLRINLSGKGTAPRFRFISRNEYPFELTNYAWVYKLKNAR